MKFTLKKKSALSLTLAASLIGSATWSNASYACSDNPILSSVCIMASARTLDFNRQYLVANGRVFNVNENAALYSLIGNNYGGDARKNTFAIPDMRGRMVLGTDSRVREYSVGNIGGAAMVTLKVEQLPSHTHAFSAANVDFSKVTATTTLGNMSASVTGSLVLKGATGGGLGNDPMGKSLATTAGPTKIYSDAPTPTIAMNAGSIDSSNLKVGSFSGNPTTTLSGNTGMSGTTDLTGSGSPVPTMPPYLVMTYYIATANATYPDYNN